MTMETDLVVVSPPAGMTQEHHSYLDWAAIIGGIVLASAISVVLLAFGAAVGLSFTNFRTFQGVAPIWAAIAGASWLLWVNVSSFMAGGYVTGRMRRRFHDASEHESDVRDGAHGLLVWAGAVVVGSLIAAGGITGAVSAVGSAVVTATTAASNVAQGAAANPSAGAAVADPTAYFSDELFRPPAGASAPNNPAAATQRTEAGRILATEATGTISADDKTYLGQLVAQNTGLPADQATARVDQVVKAMDDAKAKAADVAEQARKTAVLAAFLLAASLFVSAVGAYWAAMKGGRHRDEGTAFADTFGRF